MKFEITYNLHEIGSDLNQCLAGAVEEIKQSMIAEHAASRQRLATRSPAAGSGGLPKMTNVTSRCLSQVGYDAKTQRLYLRFREGMTVYTSYHVPVEVYGELMNAPSKGHYYQTHIKGRYHA